MRRYRGKRRRWARVLLSLLLAGILCFSALLGVVLTGIRTEMKGDPEVMIILGCQVKPWGPSVLLQDRLDTALDYLEDHPDMLVIVSGGQGPDEHISEAACMADYLIGAGYDPDLIALEDRSHSTWENLVNSAALLAELGEDAGQDILIVSNGFHLARVRMLWSRAAGGAGRLSTLAAPASHTPSRLNMYIREPLAVVKSFLLDTEVPRTEAAPSPAAAA